MERNEIYIIHGSDYKEMTVRLLEAADLAGMIGDRKKKVGLKPNLLAAIDPSEGATTHPELVEGTITYLKGKGFSDITVMEGAWVGARTSDAERELGIGELCRREGVPFVDLQQDSYHTVDAAGISMELCDTPCRMDFMINMPVLKGHCQTVVTCALKNQKGVITNNEKRRFHRMGLHKPIAHLNTVARSDFILVDNICGDLDFEEGGNPVQMDRLIGFADPVLCDAFVCDTMGYDVSEVPYIGMAEQLGVGSSDLSRARTITLNKPADAQGKRDIRQSRKVGNLSAYVDARDSCSACYGMLIHALSRLDEEGHLSRGRARDLPRICIGQAYRGQSGDVGIGSCTAGFARNLPGCPPSATQMYQFLKENWVL